MNSAGKNNIVPFGEIQNHCERNRSLSRAVIDEFIIHYAADKAKLVAEMEAAIRKYKDAAREIKVEYLNFLKSEYIAHRVFKAEGLIHKFLNHSALQSLPAEHLEYLRFQAENPWRFSFAEIVSNPQDAFFNMEDVMTGEEYLLHSPGMQATLKEHKPRLWFNLIAFNGQCWQTFGLIIPFLSFTVDDLFFFATELNPKIEDEEMLIAEVEKNPFAFFMLISASVTPIIISQGHLTLFCQASDNIPEFDFDKLRGDFEISWNKDVFRFRLKELPTIPHFAQAFYDENTGELQRTSMTEYGFEMLTNALINSGMDLPAEPEIVVSPVMQLATEKILNKKIELNPFEKYFSMEDKNDKNTNGLNQFLNLAIPFYNAGIEPDINDLAAKAGIDPSTAAELWKQVKKSTDEMKNKYK